MSELGYALIGCGRISRNHLRSIEALDQARIEVVVDPDHAKAEALAQSCRRRPRLAQDWREVVGAPGVDVVVVTAPTHCHAEIVIAAAEAGRHVYCEKAMASTTNECRRMNAAAAAAGVRMTIGQSTRFQPAILMARRLCDQGDLGETFAVDARFSTNAEPLARGATDSWRYRAGSAGHGHVINFGCHYVDTARFLLGQDPVTVSAVVSNLFSQELISEDQFSALSTCDRGALISILLRAAPAGNRDPHEGYTVHGSEGLLHVDRGSKTIVVMRGSTRSEVPVDPELLREDGFQRLHRLFRDAILSGGPVPLDGATAQRNLEWGLGTYLSSETGRRMALPLAPEHGDYAGPVNQRTIPATRA